MNRPPRNPSEQFFGIKKIIASASIGILLLAMVLVVYFLSLNEGHTANEVRAIAFAALIIGNVFLILTTLSKTRSAFSVLFEKNVALLLIIFLALGILVLLITVPFLKNIFSFDSPRASHFTISIVGAVAVLLVLEIIKFTRLNRYS